MDKDITSQLENLSFTPSEAKVYLALTEIGQTSAGEIIKKTRLHRSVVYECLEKLIDRKLVFQLKKKNIAYFQTVDPTRILQEAESKRELAKNLVKRLKEINAEKLPEITIYEGVEVYKKFWLGTVKNLPAGSTDYVAGSIGARWQELMGAQTKQFIRVKEQRKIKWKMIVFARDPLELELAKKSPELNEYRLIDKKFAKEGNFNIFGNQSLILHSGTEPMIIEIKNKTLIRVFQNIFDILWESAEKI